MKEPLRIAMFVGQFPVVSETFILRQICGLLDLGHEVDLYADVRGDVTGVVPPEVSQHRLLERTTFMDMPEASAPWELPAQPPAGETWVPGAAAPIPNDQRLAEASGTMERCRQRAPGLTERVLSESDYGYRALSLSALYRLDRVLARPGNYDVAHAHFGPIGESFRFVRELWGVPLLVSFHGYDFTTLPRQQGPQLYRKLFETADAVTANSNFTQSRLVQLGCAEEKVKLLPMGLDPGAFAFRLRRKGPDEALRLITVARLVPIKGHQFCLRAVARMRKRHPSVHYDIVGDGPLRKELELMVTQLGLADAVTLHGARDGAYIAALMANAHLAVLGSVSIEGDAEGQGLFLQEAQGCGLPVVATNHGALPEGMLPGKSGFLVPERDEKRLAERLTFLADHPGLWPELGRQGRALVEARYDSRQLTGQLVEIYTASRRGFPPPQRGSVEDGKATELFPAD